MVENLSKESQQIRLKFSTLSLEIFLHVDGILSGVVSGLSHATTTASVINHQHIRGMNTQLNAGGLCSGLILQLRCLDETVFNDISLNPAAKGMF